jgi:glycosyltransferase involved in cell wall biosynthesis
VNAVRAEDAEMDAKTDANRGAREAFRVCALIPAFNEAGTVADVITGVRPYVDGVIVVDDGSTDDTASLAEAAADAGSGARVVVLRHPENLGKGHAVRTGLAQILAPATPSQPAFTHVLLIDGDMQHRPSDVPALIAAARATGADLVVGERVFDKTRMPSSRYYSNVIGSWALSGFIGSPVRDSQSGFRLIRTDALRGMTLTSTGYEVETEMLIKLAHRRVRMTGVPVELSYGAKSKLRPVRDTTRTCFLAVYYRFLCRD